MDRSHRANAALVMLARNDEIEGVLSSMRQLEEHFNHKFGYPWVFLNDVPFSQEFISYVLFSMSKIKSHIYWLRRTNEVASSNVSYGVIPSHHWNQPDWIDESRASAGRSSLLAEGVKYASELSFLKIKMLAKNLYDRQYIVGISYMSLAQLVINH